MSNDTLNQDATRPEPDEVEEPKSRNPSADADGDGEDNVMRFSIEQSIIPVELTDADGEVHQYELVEMMGDTKESYLNRLGKRVKMENGRPAGMKEWKGMHADLLIRTLRDKETGEFVKAAFVNDLPAKAQSDLFNAAMKQSAITTKKEDAAALEGP